MSATPAASADPPIRRSADPPIRRKLCDETSRRRLVSSHKSALPLGRPVTHTPSGVGVAGGCLHCCRPYASSVGRPVTTREPRVQRSDHTSPSRKAAAAAICLLYTSDAADEEDSVDLGGRRIIK